MTHFSEPASVEWIGELAELHYRTALTALEDLTDRALLTTDETEERYFLPTLTATFLQRVRPEIVAQTGDRLVKRTFALVDENGGKKYERFPNLEGQWPTISAALPLLQQTDNIRVQSICDGISTFLDFSGHQDELLALCQLAEEKAKNAKAFNTAAVRAYQVACIFHSRVQPEELLAYASRCEEHWLKHTEQVNLGKPKKALIGLGKHERAMVIRLRGLFEQMKGNYSAAKKQLLQTQELHQSAGVKSRELVVSMNDLAMLETALGEKFDGQLYLKNALQLAREVNYEDEILICLKNLVSIKLDGREWAEAESLAREGLSRTQEIGCDRLFDLFAEQLAKSLKRDAISVRRVSQPRNQIHSD